MELSRYTDYSLRMLIYGGLHSDKIFTVSEVAERFDISEHHLTKVAYRLGTMDLLETRRGRNGGYRLIVDPGSVNLGEVIRTTESFALVECLGEQGGNCVIDGACILKGIIREATEEFLKTFDKYTLADLLSSRRALLEKIS